MKMHSMASVRARFTVGMLLALCAGAVSAVEFEVGDGWKGNWNTTIGYAQNWRLTGQNNVLYSLADGSVRGFTDGRGGSNTDAGTLNYDRNDVVSQVFKFVTDVSISKGGTGGLVRVKGWYDYALSENNVPFGNQGQRPYYSAGQPLGDYGLGVENRFQGVKLMDAYGFTQFDVGERPLQLRAGNMVINWGESLFIQGINYTGPIDLPALRRGAGTELKEFLIPVAMAYANLGLPQGMSLEAFYQLQWQRTVVDACGTYFSPAEGANSYRVGNCNIASGFGGGTSKQQIANGTFFQLVNGQKASNSGQYGVAFRFPVNAIDTEFGVYYQNVQSRVPYISVVTGQPLPAGAPVLFVPGATPVSIAAKWDFPEDIKIFGISASTTLAGWSTGFELSYTQDLPVQINGNDLLLGFVAGLGPVGPTALALAGRVPGTPAAPIGTQFNGYNRFNKTQFQANAVKLFSNVLGAENLAVVAEFGIQSNNVPDYKNGGLRYSRGFIFGTGSTPNIAGGADLCTIPVAALRNPQPDGCKNDGYVSKYSYGTRLRGTLTYNDVWGTGVTASPSLFWAQDIQGYSMDTQFIEGRSTISLGLNLSYAKRYSLDFAIVTYGDNAKFDNNRDKDFYSLGLSVTF